MIKAKRIGVLRRELMEKPRRRFIIPDVLPVGTSFWYGDNSVGKTGLVIRTAVALAGGLQWADRQVSPGSVLYVVGEDFPGVTERLSAAIEHLGLCPDDLSISVMPCPEKGMTDNGARQEIANEAKAMVKDTGLPMSLIVFDTLATCFGDENQDDATAAGKFMKNVERLARELECAALTVHHIGHRGKEMRGSSVFRKAADAVCYLDRPKGKPTVTEVTKLRGAPEGYKLAFDIAGVDLLVADGAVSVQIVKNLNPWTTAENTNAEADRAKRDFTDSAVALTLGRELAIEGVFSVKAWQTRCFDHWSNKPSDNARRKAFHGVKKALQANGNIIVAGDTVTITPLSGNIDGNAGASDGVTVTVTTTPLNGGVKVRTNSRNEDPVQEPVGSTLSERNSEVEDADKRTNVLSRGVGLESPAKRHSAAGNGATHQEAEDAA